MHDSPKSTFDNKDIWKNYDYKQPGIIGEPYFDIDFDKAFYLTDTGRCCNGYKYSVRDKVPQQERWNKEEWFSEPPMILSEPPTKVDYLIRK